MKNQSLSSDLLERLSEFTGIRFHESDQERLRAVLAEREACAHVCDVLDAEVDKYPAACAAAIRARSAT